MSKCVIGHDYALVYDLEIMPLNAANLGTEWENGNLDEKTKWFMDEEKVGKNRPLMYDFIELAKKNEEAKLSICFLVSLSQMSTSTVDDFRLKLLKNGETVIDNFEAPPKVYKMEPIQVGVNNAEVKIHHGNVAALQMSTAYYQLKATYSSIQTDVCHDISTYYKIYFHV